MDVKDILERQIDGRYKSIVPGMSLIRNLLKCDFYLTEKEVRQDLKNNYIKILEE